VLRVRETDNKLTPDTELTENKFTPDTSFAGPTVRALAAHWLDQAAQAAGRVRGAEALHDFRTSLRRLRVCLSAYRKELGAAGSRGLRRRFKRLSRETNPGRDAKVRAVWLRGRSRRLRGPGALALKRLAASHEVFLAREQRRFSTRILTRFRSAARLLRRRLQSRPRCGKRYATAAARAVARAAREMDRRFAVVRRGGNERDLHVARIRVKRLRYLLEPFAPKDRRVRSLVAGLQKLQTLLGELHDRHGIAACRLPQAAAQARDEAARLEGALRRGWLRPGRERRLIRSALAFSRALRA